MADRMVRHFLPERSSIVANGEDASMEFGIGVAPFDRWAGIQDMARVVEAADRLGYGYVSMPDHVLVPDGPEQPRSGVVFPDVVPLAGFLAGRTSSVRFVFSALVVPQREPIVLAKQL